MQDDIDGVGLPAWLAKMGREIITVDRYEGDASTLIGQVEHHQPVLV